MISVGRFYVRSVGTTASGTKRKASAQHQAQREAPLVGINSHVELIDYCAQITQTQRFRNNEKCALEATYEFELPKDCAISSFSADVGDRHLTGMVQEKQKAEERYDDALAAGHSTALLETKDEDPNTFVVQLGNVPPGIEAFVTLTYEQLATLENDKIVLTLDGSDVRSVIFADPPAKTPEADARVQPGFNFDVHISTQSPLRSVSSPSHPIVVELGETGATVRLSDDTDWRITKSFVLEAAVADPHQPSVHVQKVNDTQIAMVSFYPKIETPNTKCEMIFVLDCSGSMAGSAMKCAKSTLQFFLRSLPADAFFNIVNFGSSYERFAGESLPFNDKNLEKATRYVERLTANLGGTDIYSPLKFIFGLPTKKGYPRQVFIITDGEVEDKDNCIELVRKNANNTRLFAFGIGNSVDKDLVNRMARAGEGNCTIVRESSAIRQNVMKQLERAIQPGLTDIHITWNDAATGKSLLGIRQTPFNPPPIFRGSRLVSFALLPDNCPSSVIVLTGSFGDTDYRSEISLDPATAENVPGEQIMKLGVRSLIKDIENDIGSTSPHQPDSTKKAVVDLSVKFSVLSKHTAFVAVGTGGESLKTSMVTRRVQRTEYSGCAYYCDTRPDPVDMVDHLVCHYSYSRPPVNLMGDDYYDVDDDDDEEEEEEEGFQEEMKEEKKCEEEQDDMFAEVRRRHDPDDMFTELKRKHGHSSRHTYSKRRQTGGTKERHERDYDRDRDYSSSSSRDSGVLDKVILQQTASGCFSIAALALLGIPESAKAKRPAKLPDGVNAKLADDIWITLLVIVGLEWKFGSKKAEWNFLANKSIIWARNILHASYDAWYAAAEAAF